MKLHRRRFVAFLAGKVMGNEGSYAVYDCDLSAQTGFSGKISAAGIFMFDLEQKRRIVGRRASDRISLIYDTEPIDLVVSETDKTFRGYDAESQREFRGTVSGSSVTLYDEEENKDYTYTL